MKKLLYAHRALVAASPVLLGLLLGGCPTVGPLPDEFDVAISGADKRSAEKSTGPDFFANGTWAIFRKPVEGEQNVDEAPPGPYGGLLSGGVLARPPADEQVYRIDFGDRGQMIFVHENRYFLPDIYGVEVPVNGEWSSTTLPGLVFRSGSYGLLADNRFGLAVLIQVRYFGISVGHAVLYSWGTVTGRDAAGAANRIDGTFGYLLDFREGLGRIFLETTADQYPVYGIRASE